MSANIAASTADQGSLNELAARIRDAHAGVATAFSNALDRALDAGETLIFAKTSKLVRHGQWGEFLKRCGVRERQAERYMRIACLVAANPTCKSDLAELSIEQAIKLLSPPKPLKETPTRGQPPKNGKPDRSDFTGTDIIAAWNSSLPDERTGALSTIGPNSVLGAMPLEWWAIIESIIARRHPSQLITTSDAISDDLEIPTFLRRELTAAPSKAEVASPLKRDPKIDNPDASSATAVVGMADGSH
jgi:hypothetical protein